MKSFRICIVDKKRRGKGQNRGEVAERAIEREVGRFCYYQSFEEDSEFPSRPALRIFTIPHLGR